MREIRGMRFPKIEKRSVRSAMYGTPATFPQHDAGRRDSSAMSSGCGWSRECRISPDEPGVSRFLEIAFPWSLARSNVRQNLCSFSPRGLVLGFLESAAQLVGKDFPEVLSFGQTVGLLAHRCCDQIERGVVRDYRQFPPLVYGESGGQQHRCAGASTREQGARRMARAGRLGP